MQLLFVVVSGFGALAADPEVLIVGAGWAGMSAAHELARANVSFLVLEARSYTGGRSHAIQFGSAAVGVHTMEVGSGWLESSGKSGGPEHAPPPLVSIAKRMQPPLKWAFVPGSTQNMSNYQHVYTADGKLGDADGKIRHAANAAYACISKTANNHGGNPTVREALTDCGWKPTTAVERAVDWALTVDDPGMTAKTQVLRLTLPDNVYEWWGPDDHFITDQRPRGYAGVLDEMVKDTVPPGDPRVLLNTTVTRVDYTSTGVQVTTASGRIFKSKVAITTFPLGVLTRHHRDLFHPPVHKKLAKILDSGNFVMSNLTRVYLQFPSVFWDDSGIAFLGANDGEPGVFPEFRNINHKIHVPGSNILLLFLGNPESVKYESMTDAQVQSEVMAKLKKIFPTKTVPEPSAFHMTRWGLDPLAYGCYSALKVGFNDDEFSAITKPLKDSDGNTRVFLGGEAMCDDLSGSTYGAHQSGRQIVQTYLHETGRGKKPMDICWY